MTERRLLVVFALFLALSAVVSGPLVGAVDLTRAERPPGAGSADVAVESVPTDDIVLAAGRFGAGRYHLTAPAAVVTVRSVTGNPVLRYSVDVPGLWLTASSRYELGGTAGTQLRLTPNPSGVSPQRVEAGRYNATVSIWLRTGDLQTDLFQRPITVEVER